MGGLQKEERQVAVLNFKRVEEAIRIVTAKHCKGIFAAGIEAEDLHQTLWVKALEAAEVWSENKPALLYVFLQKSMENAVMDMLSRSIRHPKPFSVDSINRAEGEEVGTLDMEEKTVNVGSIVAVALEKARRSLKPEDRELFVLVLENKTQKQMAEKLGCSQSNVSLCAKTIHNALSWMKEDLNKGMEENHEEDRVYSAVARYTDQSVLGEMEFLITTENYLNMQTGHGELTLLYEGVSLHFLSESIPVPGRGQGCLPT